MGIGEKRCADYPGLDGPICGRRGVSIPMRGRADAVARHCGLIASHAHHCDKQGAGEAADEECCSDPPEKHHRTLCSAPRELKRAPWQRGVAGLRAKASQLKRAPRQRGVAGLRAKASHVTRDVDDDSRARVRARFRERLANVGRDAIRVVECLCVDSAARAPSSAAVCSASAFHPFCKRRRQRLLRRAHRRPRFIVPLT